MQAATVPQAIDLWADGGLTVQDATAWSGIKRSSLYAAMDAGRLAFTKHGTRRLISRASLRLLLAAGHGTTVAA